MKQKCGRCRRKPLAASENHEDSLRTQLGRVMGDWHWSTVVYLINRYPSLVADSQRKPLVAAGELVRGAYITPKVKISVFLAWQWWRTCAVTATKLLNPPTRAELCRAQPLSQSIKSEDFLFFGMTVIAHVQRAMLSTATLFERHDRRKLV
jgi:hypothetical protein